MEGKIGVGTAETCDEMVFEGLDGAFGSVASMNAGRSELMVDALLVKVVFQELRTFIVKAMELRA